MNSTSSGLYPQINAAFESLRLTEIDDSRKAILNPLVDYIQSKVESSKPIRINFICTHNSRRSHFAQIWAQVLAHYFKVQQLQCYSGGTEATALFPKVLDTLKAVGFDIKEDAPGNNPVYSIQYGPDAAPIRGFSKKMDDDFNPKSNFAAVMTCSEADEGCPFVPGAEARIPITFEDPKAFDNTPLQDEKYMERCMQIASELFYVFSKIQS